MRWSVIAIAVIVTVLLCGGIIRHVARRRAQRRKLQQQLGAVMHASASALIEFKDAARAIEQRHTGIVQRVFEQSVSQRAGDCGALLAHLDNTAARVRAQACAILKRRDEESEDLSRAYDVWIEQCVQCARAARAWVVTDLPALSVRTGSVTAATAQCQCNGDDALSTSPLPLPIFDINLEVRTAVLGPACVQYEVGVVVKPWDVYDVFRTQLGISRSDLSMTDHIPALFFNYYNFKWLVDDDVPVFSLELKAPGQTGPSHRATFLLTKECCTPTMLH